MNALALPFPKRIKGKGHTRTVALELRFRVDYHEGELSQGEIEALSPYLSELAAELLTILSTDDDRG